MATDRIELRFVEIFYELGTLESYMNSIETQLPSLIKIEEEKMFKRLRYKGSHNDTDELDEIRKKLFHLAEDVYPRYFRGLILVTLWAIFESAIYKIAKEIKDQQEHGVGLNDIRGDLLRRTKKYFNHILKFPLDTGGNDWRQLQILKVLRNAIVHGNGQLDNIKNEADIKKIEKWEQENIGITIIMGSLLFSPDLVRKTFAAVSSTINNLTQEVVEQYPDPINW